jgi:hypothetical protein
MWVSGVCDLTQREPGDETMKTFTSLEAAKTYAAEMFAKYDTAKSVIVHVANENGRAVYDIDANGKVASC